jgi:murein L,D-transpeptidase YafK
MPRLPAPSALALFAAVFAATPGPTAAAPSDVALVRVDKAARRITLHDDAGRLLRAYSGIQLGFQPIGPKQVEGDGRTPEGRYTVDWGNEASAYHLSLHISYPAPADRARAAALGRSPGGAIFIHGQPNSLQNGRIVGDWTAGCIAVSNEEIEDLWALVPDGTPIDITP